MATVTLNADEQDCSVYLARRFDSGDKRFRVADLPAFDRLGMVGTEPLINRFENMGWVQWETNQTLFIHGKLLNDIDSILHPPPKDYWHSLAVWFRSRWWSVPVFIALVALPLLVQWIEMIDTLLRWLGAAE